jgi:H+/Cl- antiporter ClcA
VHEQKGIVIAAVIAALGFACGAWAQKDAAEKAKEGGIEHWIEYYKGEQRKRTAPSAQEPVASPVDRTAPVERTESGASPLEKTN